MRLRLLGPWCLGADPLDLRAMESHLSAREAAEFCGVSEKTIRNWIVAGRLSAEKVNGTFQIAREQLEPLRRPSAQSARTTHNAEWAAEVVHQDDCGEAATRGAAPSVPASELMTLLREAQAEAITKAEAAAMWQARAEMLVAELNATREQLHALMPPTSVATSVPHPQPSRRRWWKFWQRDEAGQERVADASGAPTWSSTLS
jgi:excisionase family DNA binding protein